MFNGQGTLQEITRALEEPAFLPLPGPVHSAAQSNTGGKSIFPSMLSPVPAPAISNHKTGAEITSPTNGWAHSSCHTDTQRQRLQSERNVCVIGTM